MASKVVPRRLSSSSLPVVTGASNSPRPNAATARSSRRSGRCKSVCTTTTMKSIETRMSPIKIRIGCSDVVIAFTGVVTMTAKPLPIWYVATASGPESKVTIAGVAEASAWSSAEVGTSPPETTRPATVPPAAKWPPRTTASSAGSALVARLWAMAAMNAASIGRATNTVTSLLGTLALDSSHG